MSDEIDTSRNEHGKLCKHIPFVFNPKSDVFFRAESKRIITKLFKYYLTILEDLRYQHEHSLDRLKDDLSPEQLEVLNYLDFHRYSMMRKRVLDNGNETVRDLHNFLENFDIKLKNNISDKDKLKQEKGD